MTWLDLYLKLLESAFLVNSLEVFSLGLQRKRVSSPKLNFWNNALVNALSTRTLEESLADPVWWGRLEENALGGIGIPLEEFLSKEPTVFLS